MISTMPFLRRFASRPKPVDRGTASDAELALAARVQDRGGKEAFVEIVQRHQAAVCAVAYGITGRMALTEDMAQETFLYAWKNMKALREPARLKAWLTKIARSTALDALRREGRTEPLGDDVAEIFSPEAAPDAAAADAEDERLVWDALAELPETFRLPLALYYNEGQSIAAVAETLELSGDAVKQRLSRGREALREKVAARMAAHAESKLAGVLRRVQPGPLLVVSIAAAIGLIAAPAAMAAGAFSSAATGAAAGGSAATASTFSTAMTASSYLVAGLTMAAFIPLGWRAREPDAVPAAPPPVVQKPAAAVNPLTLFSGSELLKEWQRLHETHGTDAAAMPGIYAEIEQEKNAFRRRALRSALISEWGVLDPATAFAFLQFDKKQSEQTTLLMREWLARDPAAAAQHLAANAEKAAGLARQLLMDVAKAAPAELVEIVRRLPATDRQWDREVQRAFAEYAAKHPDDARAAALALPAANRAQALAGAAEGWAQHDGPAALAWSRTLPEGAERDESLRATLVGWAKSDPAAALANLDAAPPMKRDNYFASDTAAQVLRAAAEKDFEATLRVLEEHHGKLGRESWHGLTEPLQSRLEKDPAATLAWLSSQPEGLRLGLKTAFDSIMLNDGYAQKDAVWAWLKAQPASAFTEELTGMMLRITSWKEPEEAMKHLAGLENNNEARAAMEQQFDTMLREGQSQEQLDAMIARLPEKWRAGMLATAFTRGGDWMTGDLKPWIARMEQLPEESRPQAAMAVAGRMAAADPQAAVQWANSLSDASQKELALRGLIGSWANADSYEASAWVDTLPQGRDRDHAAAALAGSVVQSDPEAAWTWAASIGDNQERLTALGMTFSQTLHQDPQRARHLLSIGNIPADVRARFLEALDNHSSPRPAPIQTPAVR